MFIAYEQSGRLLQERMNIAVILLVIYAINLKTYVH